MSAASSTVDDDPLGVITNSPAFDWHMTNLRNYVNFSMTNVPSVQLGPVKLEPFGQGSGMLGLPGDFTPPSRFVRAVAFSQSVFPSKTGDDAVLEAFHILNQFDIPKGAAREHEKDEHGNILADYTAWTAASDLKAKQYYFRTYDNLKEEFFKSILPPTIYFFVALHLVMFIRVLMLEGTGLAPSSSISIAVAALILGKAVLLADMLPMINRFPAKPLIYNIAWKTVIYLLISAVIHYLERLIDFWRETGGFVAGNEKLLSEIIWPHFLGHPDHSLRPHRRILHGA